MCLGLANVCLVRNCNQLVIRFDLHSVVGPDTLAVVREKGRKPPKRKGQDMTRKDYEIIAKAITEAFAWEIGKKEGEHAISRVAHILANSLRNDNPRFNEDKFLKACGL